MSALITTLTLILLDLPLFVILGGLTMALFWIRPHPGSEAFLESWVDFANNFNMLERAVGLAQQPTLVAIPFFTLAGIVMSRGSIARRLIELADAAFGWLPGGMAISTVAACALFAAISGSSPVTVITIGSVMFPALLLRRYPERFSLGLVTSAGSLGIIIPPSIPMIVFAIFATQAGAPVKVEELFIAGFLPGLLIAGALILYCVVVGWHFERDRFDLRRIVRAFSNSAWSLVVPVVILGGIYLGVFDTTAAAGIAVILALGIEIFIHRSLTFDDLPSVMAECGVLMGSVLVIIGVALGMSEYLTIHKIPEEIVTWLRAHDLSPVSFIILLDVILLVIGCLMDIISAIILFVPLFVPIALALGFDPIHIGLIFIVNLEIGYLTPPIGLNLFVAAGLFNKTFGYTLRATTPFVLVIFVCLGLITAVPAIPLWLVNVTRPASERVDMNFPSGDNQMAARTGGGDIGDDDQGTAVDVLSLTGAATATDPSDANKGRSMARIMDEARDTGVIGDEVGGEYFTPVAALLRIDTGDGRARIDLVDLPLCVATSEDGAVPQADDDILVLRVELPADAPVGDYKVPGQASVVFGTVVGGRLKVTARATAGVVAIAAPATDPDGLFGVFSVELAGATVGGKFLPQSCAEGEVAATVELHPADSPVSP